MALLQNPQRAPVDVVGGPPIAAGATGEADLSIAYNEQLVDRGVLVLVDPDVGVMASPVGVRARPTFGQRDVLIDLGAMSDGEALVKVTDDEGLVQVEGVSLEPLDSDLVAIAALSTTSYGRALLTLADAAAAKTVLSLGKSDVGLGNVDNTSDASKPVSAAQAAAITTAVNALVNGADAAHDTFGELQAIIANDESGLAALITAVAGKQPLDSDLTAIAALSTTTFGRALLTMADAPAAKTALALVKADVGLGSVDNTSDTAKPVSTAQQAALDAKLDADLLGAPDGAAQLDGAGKVPVSSLDQPVISGSGLMYTGTEAVIRPKITALTVGTEYSWLKTNGAGVLLDIVSGVA